MRKLVWFRCALALALAGGCGGDVESDVMASGGASMMPGATGGTASGGTASGGTNTTGGEGGGGAPCTGSLDAVATGRLYACPPDYGAAEQWPTTCSSWGYARLGSCGGWLAFTINNGTGGQYCYYDPVTRALVGAASVEDVRSFCQHTSSRIVAGTVPGDCPDALLGDLGVCPNWRPTCSPAHPCDQGACEGTACGVDWTCVTEGLVCSDDAADYCGCDHVTFRDSATCPRIPYEHRGACEATTN